MFRFGKKSSSGLRKEELFDRLLDSLDSQYEDDRLTPYYNDPVRFCIDILKLEPTKQQEQLMKAIAQHDHVAARSGHGVGKTVADAALVHWFLRTRRHAKVPITAPTLHQLEDVFWSELITQHRQMEPAFRDQFEFTSDRYYHKAYRESWFAVARTAREERPEAFQGFHGTNLLFVVDEPSGVPDAVFQVSEGALTSKGNKALLTGNPTRLSGFFFECFHSDRGRWTCLHFPSTESPLVDKSYIKRMEKRYGSNSSVYRVRVLGEFPLSEDDQLIPLDLLEAAARREIPEEGAIVWGVDVARFGSDESALCKRVGDVITSIETVRGFDLMQLAGWIARQYFDTKQKPSEIFVDVIGIGSGLADRLRELKLPVIDVNVSESAGEKMKFLNLRSELWWRFKEWLQLGRAKIPNDEDLIAQSSGIKYQFSSDGRIQIESKDSIRSRGKVSPDRADALILTFKHEPDVIARVDIQGGICHRGGGWDDPITSDTIRQMAISFWDRGPGGHSPGGDW
jgi:phage terminase large subunit